MKVKRTLHFQRKDLKIDTAHEKFNGHEMNKAHRMTAQALMYSS